jgi:hypothetical protein
MFKEALFDLHVGFVQSGFLKKSGHLIFANIKILNLLKLKNIYKMQ